MERKEEMEIRKGPWKAEEDEVLIDHVKKYGAKDWSSIRSKGLLQRTGKSCRLRWVNKLRPNLKNGCKFSSEEERIVIKMQAEYGNKWAKIASFLTGRTDNDVKNFWSSRQKRLARILQTSSAAPGNLQKNKKEAVSGHDVPSLETVKFSGLSEGESSSKAFSCSSPCIGNNSEVFNMMPLQEISNQRPFPGDETEAYFVQPDFNQIERKTCVESQTESPFPAIPQLTDLPFTSESQELLARIGEPHFFDMLGLMDAADLICEEQLPIVPKEFEPDGSSVVGASERLESSMASDSFFDDFPEDLFDHKETSAPSPSGH